MVNVLVRRSENLCHGLDSHSQVNSPGIGKLQIFATLASTSVEILKDVGIPDRLTCLLRNCMQVKKQQLELDVEQHTGSKLEKEYFKAIYCHPAFF